MRISAEQVPSLHMVATRYLELVTFSNFWLFMLIIALMLFMLLVHSICRCSVYKFVGEVFKFKIVAAIRSMSSANRKLHIGLPPMEMEVWWS